MSYICKLCKYKTDVKFNYKRHLMSQKHINKVPFNCNVCLFQTNTKNKLQRHLTTKKHINNMKKLSIEESRKQTCIINNSINDDFTTNYKCEKCNKHYTNKSSYWYHIKNCKNDCIINTEETLSNKLVQLIKSNEEFKTDMLININKIANVINNNAIQHNTINNTINNTIHNNMTINVFLNEHCKDAMNISDFVNNLQVTEKDLFHTGEVGYVEGLLNIIVNKLSMMKITERPLHCTDIKRTRFYIKDNDKWERDNDNEIIKKTINDISQKQFDKLCYWIKDNMNYILHDDDLSNKYDKMYTNISDYNDNMNNVKILKKLCKKTKLNKDIKV